MLHPELQSDFQAGLREREQEERAAELAEVGLDPERVTSLGEETRRFRDQCPRLWREFKERTRASLTTPMMRAPQVTMTAGELLMYRAGQNSAFEWLVELTELRNEGGEDDG